MLINTFTDCFHCSVRQSFFCLFSVFCSSILLPIVLSVLFVHPFSVLFVNSFTHCSQCSVRPFFYRLFSLFCSSIFLSIVLSVLLSILQAFILCILLDNSIIFYCSRCSVRQFFHRLFFVLYSVCQSFKRSPNQRIFGIFTQLLPHYGDLLMLLLLLLRWAGENSPILPQDRGIPYTKSVPQNMLI